jgi:5-methylcytosine-specific restriction endonuclease McrA
MKLAYARRRRIRTANEGTKRFYYPRDKALALAYRHGYKCHICGKLIDVSQRAPHRLALSIDHLIPQADGGTHDTTNLAPAHFECNSLRQHTGTAQLQAW